MDKEKVIFAMIVGLAVAMVLIANRYETHRRKAEWDRQISVRARIANRHLDVFVRESREGDHAELPKEIATSHLRDPHTGLAFRIIHTSDTLTIYSIGPDGIDQNAQLPFDPTNGTYSSGDIFRVIPTR